MDVKSKIFTAESFKTLNGWHVMKDSLIEKLGVQKLYVIFKKVGITPNQITVLAAVFAGLAFYFLIKNNLLFAIFLFVNIVLDALDGGYARFLNKESRWGEALDHWVDFLVEVAMEVKVVLFLGNLWLLLIPALFVFDFVQLRFTKKHVLRFPARYGMFLFMFGLYLPGLILQAILPPLTWIASAFFLRPSVRK